MSKLPNAANVVVESAKIHEYVLNPGNPQNGGKAALFAAFGFARDDWAVLADAFRGHPLNNEIVETRISQHGTKYAVKCSLATPDARNPCITTVWIIDNGRSIPRFITAYQ